MSGIDTRITSPDAPPVQRNWWVYLILIGVCVLNVMPYLWMVMTGFMDKASAASTSPQWIFTPSLEAFELLIQDKGIMKNFMNSLIVSVSSTFFSVTIGMFCAYAIARYDFVGRDDVSFWVLTNRMMPPVAVLIPIFVTFQTLKLLDTLPGLIILYTAMQLPFVVWMLTGYFRDIPRRYEESAMVDGDTWFQAFRKVTLPLIRLLKNHPEHFSVVCEAVEEPVGETVRAERVLRLLVESGELKRARDEAAAYVRRAQESLKIFPETMYRRALYDIAQYIIDRDR